MVAIVVARCSVSQSTSSTPPAHTEEKQGVGGSRRLLISLLLIQFTSKNGVDKGIRDLLTPPDAKSTPFSCSFFPTLLPLHRKCPRLLVPTVENYLEKLPKLSFEGGRVSPTCSPCLSTFTILVQAYLRPFIAPRSNHSILFHDSNGHNRWPVLPSSPRGEKKRVAAPISASPISPLPAQ